VPSIDTFEELAAGTKIGSANGHYIAHYEGWSVFKKIHSVKRESLNGWLISELRGGDLFSRNPKLSPVKRCHGQNGCD